MTVYRTLHIYSGATFKHIIDRGYGIYQNEKL